MLHVIYAFTLCHAYRKAKKKKKKTLFIFMKFQTPPRIISHIFKVRSNSLRSMTSEGTWHNSAKYIYLVILYILFCNIKVIRNQSSQGGYSVVVLSVNNY